MAIPGACAEGPLLASSPQMERLPSVVESHTGLSTSSNVAGVDATLARLPTGSEGAPDANGEATAVNAIQPAITERQTIIVIRWCDMFGLLC